MSKISTDNRNCRLGWFSSHYYHLLYKHRDDVEARKFLDKLITHLKLKKGISVLDLACGRGRHSFYLAKKGFDVTGVDISEENIIVAKKTSPPAPLLKKGEGSNFPTFLVRDMREVVKENCFDVALNLFTSFGYFESEKDDMKVLSAVHSELKTGGFFVLDFLNSKKAIECMECKEIKVIDGIKFYLARSFEKGFILKKIKIDDEEKIYFFEEKVKALTLKDFKKYFSLGGFEIQDILGDYELSSFDEKNSDRLIIVAKKTSPPTPLLKKERGVRRTG